MNFIKELVKDWGGFEKLLTDMNNTGEVVAEHNVKLEGQAGVKRQVDVLITHKQGPYSHKIIGECRYWSQKIKRMHVDALLTTVRDLGASKGVIFTTKGFQSGAKKMASQNAIDLFLVRELTEEEWGAPGRKFHLFLQVCSRSIYNVRIPQPVEALVLNPAALSGTSVNLEITLGDSDSTSSKTPTVKADGHPGRTVEQILDEAATRAIKDFLKTDFLINNGEDCKRYMSVGVNVPFQDPLRIPIPGAIVIVPKVEFDLGIRIDQSQLHFDRMNNYTYALAVEDCVNSKVFVGSRKSEDAKANLQPIVTSTAANFTPSGQAVQSGSLLRVIVTAWFDSKELVGLSPVPMKAPGGSPS